MVIKSFVSGTSDKVCSLIGGKTFFTRQKQRLTDTLAKRKEPVKILNSIGNLLVQLLAWSKPYRGRFENK